MVCVRYDPGSGHAAASASLDGTVFVKSCFMKELDGDEGTGPFAHLRTNGETIFKFNPGCWVNMFAFSSDGSQFVYGSKYIRLKNNTMFCLAHDSSLYFYKIEGSEVDDHKIKKPKAVSV